MVALSELRDAQLGAFRRGGKAIKAPCRNSTRMCNACGKIEKFDAAKERTHKCSGCGAVWDQDENASDNLLETFQLRPASCRTWLRVVDHDEPDEAAPKAPATEPKTKPKRKPRPGVPERMPGEGARAYSLRLYAARIARLEQAGLLTTEGKD